MLHCVARVRSSRSVVAFGVVRSCGQHAAGALVDHLERTDHADRLAAATALVGELDPVQRERRRRRRGPARRRRSIARAVARPRRIARRRRARAARRRRRCCADRSRAERFDVGVDSTSYGGAVTSSSGSSGSSAARRRVRSGAPVQVATRMPTWPGDHELPTDTAASTSSSCSAISTASSGWPISRSLARSRPIAALPRRRASGAVRDQQLGGAVEEQEAALAAIGIPAAGDVLTSANAAALLIEPGERVLVCGGDGVVEAVDRPARPWSSSRRCRAWPIDAVDRRLPSHFDYEAMLHATPSGARRRPADRHERRRHLPDAGRADPWRRCDPRSIVTASGVVADHRRQAVRADGRAGARSTSANGGREGGGDGR